MKLENIIIAIITFILLTIFLYLWNSRKAKIILGKKKKKNKKYEIIEIKYLMLTYDLKKEKHLVPKIILMTSLMDGFIISIVFLIVMLLPWKIYRQLLVGLVLLMGLIYSLYGILGKILVKKGYKE